VGQSSSETRRIVQIIALVVIGLVAACGVCGMLLLIGSFFLAPQ